MPKPCGKEQKKGVRSLNYSGLVLPLIMVMQELKTLFNGDHAELMRPQAANDTETAGRKAANDNVTTLRTEFEAYKAAHP